MTIPVNKRFMTGSSPGGRDLSTDRARFFGASRNSFDGLLMVITSSMSPDAGSKRYAAKTPMPHARCDIRV